MKSYLHIPFLSRWERGRKTQCIPLSAGISLSWYDYEFTLCDDEGYFPRGSKKGKHLFSISIGIMWWSLSWIFYEPDKEFVPVVGVPTDEEKLKAIKAAQELFKKDKENNL